MDSSLELSILYILANFKKAIVYLTKIITSLKTNVKTQTMSTARVKLVSENIFLIPHTTSESDCSDIYTRNVRLEYEAPCALA